MNKLGLVLAASLLCCGEPAFSAGFFTNGVPPAGGVQFPGTIPLTGNEALPADTNLAPSVQPQSESITTGQLRTFIQNGITTQEANNLANAQMQVAQQGTAAHACGTTSTTNFEMGADRWFCSQNAAGTASEVQQVGVTGNPGFAEGSQWWRNTGSNVQPVCLMQAMPTSVSVSLQGQYVLLSAYLEALSGLTSNLGAVQAYVITGTGNDEGFGVMTASPAVTPAWTGLAVQVAGVWDTTTTWARFSGTAVLVPSTTTEVGVELCFSPVGAGSSTDGVVATGVQLERSSIGASSPSPFEFQSFQHDLVEAQAFFYQLNEPPTASPTGINGMLYTASSQEYQLALPERMRGTIPVIAIGASGTFVIKLGSGDVVWASPAAGVCNPSACSLSSGNSISAIGQGAVQLWGAGGSGVLTVRSDKVL